MSLIGSVFPSWRAPPSDTFGFNLARRAENTKGMPKHPRLKIQSSRETFSVARSAARIAACGLSCVWRVCGT